MRVARMDQREKILSAKGRPTYCQRILREARRLAGLPGYNNRRFGSPDVSPDRHIPRMTNMPALAQVGRGKAGESGKEHASR
jgi:hypothetical protein